MQQASDWIIKVGSAIAAIITLMQLYVVIVGFPPVMLHRTIFLVLIFILVFLTYPRDNIRMNWWKHAAGGAEPRGGRIHRRHL